ncbi:hypothetical protein FQA39_LY14508 [Lamprigera yunnana]|nr:hypothetical protein FQA39_LY14508 [Lamprigera yunnana]
MVKFSATRMTVFVQNNTEKTATDNKNANMKETEKSVSSRNTKTNTTRSRRSSLDLYEEAAAILGLTCSETNSCRCLECQPVRHLNKSLVNKWIQQQQLRDYLKVTSRLQN